MTPDEWMIPLFGQEEPEGKPNVREGRLIWLALSALRIGVNVVLDFGVWARTNGLRCERWLPGSEQPASWSTCKWTRRTVAPGSGSLRDRRRNYLRGDQSDFERWPQTREMSHNVRPEQSDKIPLIAGCEAISVRDWLDRLDHLGR